MSKVFATEAEAQAAVVEFGKKVSAVRAEMGTHAFTFGVAFQFATADGPESYCGFSVDGCKDCAADVAMRLGAQTIREVMSEQIADTEKVGHC